MALPSYSADKRTPLSVLFLMDSSGSMKDNDKQDVRIAAAESLVAMMSQEDEVSVVEFGSVANILMIGNRTQWASVHDKPQIYQTLQGLGKDSQFTDFRAALEASSRVFDGVDPTRRKVILLLTDGILDPNPEDEAYAPHHLSFRLDVLRAGKAGRKRVLEEYRQRLSPIARRLIDSQAIPDLRRQGIEVFSVGLSANADNQFLQNLSQQTSKRPEELHSFHAEQATDLITVFSQLLMYWTDLEILYQDSGVAGPATQRKVYLDEYVQQARLLVLTDAAADPFLQSSSGAEAVEAGTHRSLHLFPMKAGAPLSWDLGFRSGAGQFRSIVVGTSGLHLEVSGIESQYRFGDSVRAAAQLRSDAELKSLPLPNAVVRAEIRSTSGPTQTVDFRPEAGKYILTWKPTQSGTYKLTVNAQLESPTGRQVLPRRGLVYQFEVLQSLYAEPTSITFGTISKGASPSREIRLHSGLSETVELRVSSRIKGSSSGAFRRNEKARMPQINPLTLTVPAGSIVPFSIRPVISSAVDWGDYEGEVLFSTSEGAVATVQFALHVPSLWENLRWWILGLLVLLSVLIGYLSWVLGWLRAPSGTLVPVGNCPGSVRGPVRLSQVRRDFFTHWLNWRRNRLSLSEMNLPDRPASLDIEFVFQTWGAVFISNISPIAVFEVREAGGASFTIKPGRSLRLANRAVLTIGPCCYRYDAS